MQYHQLHVSHRRLMIIARSVPNRAALICPTLTGFSEHFIDASTKITVANISVFARLALRLYKSLLATFLVVGSAQI